MDPPPCSHTHLPSLSGTDVSGRLPGGHGDVELDRWPRGCAAAAAAEACPHARGAGLVPGPVCVCVCACVSGVCCLKAEQHRCVLAPGVERVSYLDGSP